MTQTHQVVNQVTPLADVNLFEINRPLQEALHFNAPDVDVGPLVTLGRLAGSAAMQDKARQANVCAPELCRYDAQGHRIDEVVFHPAYHDLMAVGVSAGLHGTPWAGESTAPHVLRAAGFMLLTELEPSVMCPLSMTYAATPALRSNQAINAAWQPKLVSRDYDPRLVALTAKRGVTMGMGMTEKQGGSDVRANTSHATVDGVDEWGDRYRLSGHKWFMSAPMSDAFLMLAQAPGGLSCFFVPRVLPDGTRNGLHIQRLKDKTGNRANASAEVEFDDLVAWRIGDEGRGVAQILEMGTRTRLDCALGTSGLMRQALSQAIHHTRQRKAFGKFLVDLPLMKNVLADLALESEAATALALRLARAFQNTETAHERALARILTPVAKYWICKRGSLFAQEAMECLGGNGYIEEGGRGVMARIYREMPVNSIWEGSGNVMALDVLRALQDPAVVDALLAEVAFTRGAHAALDDAMATLPDCLTRWGKEQPAARRLTEQIALLMQAALLVQIAPHRIADAFCDARLGGDSGLVFGTLSSEASLDAIITRALS